MMATIQVVAPHVPLLIMELGVDIWTSLIAVGGTLAGVALTGYITHRSARRQADVARRERSSTELLDACAAMLLALDLRNDAITEYWQGFRENMARSVSTDAPVEESGSATDLTEPYHLANRKVSHAVARIQLLTGRNSAISAAALRAATASEEVTGASDFLAMLKIEDAAWDAAGDFLDLAYGLLAN
ncbi:hypothetical protein [Kutzneria buriramensis]|uniref:Uncharacterized protein n=1 Tax=Kutzneria buriramensis TaxID=1045776 RepID=A0A3E0HLF8_9PSEU|nr:hypothetical protein [Kutzneria buriramensis]REH47313.1 hypothetical protein BCF44_106478 [Kutzneria buriramensis]